MAKINQKKTLNEPEVFLPLTHVARRLGSEHTTHSLSTVHNITPAVPEPTDPSSADGTMPAVPACPVGGAVRTRPGWKARGGACQPPPATRGWPRPQWAGTASFRVLAGGECPVAGSPPGAPDRVWL